MVTTRKRALSAEIPASPKRRSKEDAEEQQRRRRSPSPPGALGGRTGDRNEDYEKLRGERIRENMERLQKLGIIDLSLKLKRSQCQLLSLRRSSVPRSPPDLINSPPSRRSSRLQNITPVSYAEIHVKKVEDTVRNRSGLVEEGPKEEVYTDEHEKLLGMCEMSWTLFVDGYGKDGKRIYDQIKGMTCHQCRQKTLGHRTQCCKCNLVQGQFCGDCLYMRYGENVLEVKKNPNWICPVCRGICNCSLCRTKKGWAPTGCLYKKVLNLGFKSVAHYLIQTRRGQRNSGDQNSAQTSSKKSLSFIDIEDSSQADNSLESKDGLNSAPYDKNSGCNGKTGSQSADEHTASNVVVENTAMLRNKSEKEEKEPAATAKPSLDCIASRLRKRHSKA